MKIYNIDHCRDPQGVERSRQTISLQIDILVFSFVIVDPCDDKNSTHKRCRVEKCVTVKPEEIKIIRDLPQITSIFLD